MRRCKAEYADFDSKEHIELENDVENAILPILNKSINFVKEVGISQVKCGSTIVTFDVIMSSSAPNNITSAAEIAKILTNAVQNEELDIIGPVANQTIAVRGRYINGCFFRFILFSPLHIL